MRTAQGDFVQGFNVLVDTGYDNEAQINALEARGVTVWARQSSSLSNCFSRSG